LCSRKIEIVGYCIGVSIASLLLRAIMARLCARGNIQRRLTNPFKHAEHHRFRPDRQSQRQ